MCSLDFDSLGWNKIVKLGPTELKQKKVTEPLALNNLKCFLWSRNRGFIFRNFALTCDLFLFIT